MKIISALTDLLIPTVSAKAAADCRLIDSYCRGGLCCYVYRCYRSDGSSYISKACL